MINLKDDDNRVLRDTVHNYISVPKRFFPIIDSIEFQRLRHIKQTGYSALFPSATHNRFQHSLGVFHLGNIAATYLLRNSSVFLQELRKIWKQEYEEKIEMYKETFLLACLLHDFGHLPFSHTGEVSLPISSVVEIVKKFKKEFVEKDGFPSCIIKNAGNDFDCGRHEAISVILAIEKFNELFKGGMFDKQLFARIITGGRHKEVKISNDPVKQFENVLINLLNSKLIDVDKLDYVMRDAVATGLNNVNIDTYRLLASLTIVKGSTIHHLGFDKRAISILENVVFANNWQRRWIQSHPTITYEDEMLRNILKEFFTSIKFNVEMLKPPLLLSDSDVLQFAKGILNDKKDKLYTAVENFFGRESRLKPLWKTETEFALYIKEFDKAKKDLIFATLTDIMRMILNATNAGSEPVNEDARSIKLDEQIITVVEKAIKKAPRDTIEKYKNLLTAIKLLKKCLNDCGQEFDLTIIFTHYAKQAKLEDIGELLIYDKNRGNASALKEYLPHLIESNSASLLSGELFFIYTNKKEKDSAKKLTPKKLIDILASDEFLSLIS